MLRKKLYDFKIVYYFIVFYVDTVQFVLANAALSTAHCGNSANPNKAEPYVLTAMFVVITQMMFITKPKPEMINNFFATIVILRYVYPWKTKSHFRKSIMIFSEGQNSC